MKIISNLIFSLSASLLLLACSGPQQPASDAPTSAAATTVESSDPAGQAFVEDGVSSQNILQVAIGSKDHSTLVAAVQAAELENVLANNGPLTVFAPVNSAFDALPAGTVENLLKPENKSTLSRIIKYHAAPGTYGVDRLTDGLKLYQASGHYVDVTNDNGNVTVDGAKILATVEASNGIIHVVDAVMLPPEAQ